MHDPETGEVVRSAPFDADCTAFAVREYVTLAQAAPRYATRERWLPVVEKWLEFSITYPGDGADLELVACIHTAYFASVQEAANPYDSYAAIATDTALDAMFIQRGLDPVFFPELDEKARQEPGAAVDQNAPGPAERTTGPDDFDRHPGATGGAA